jgi:hypothetical protein
MPLFCRKCNISVSNQLQELTDTTLLNEKDGEPHIPKGYYIISDGGYYTSTEGKLIINISDLINCKNHRDKRRLGGCCGLDGLDGPNKVCRNGHEIGTERSDCWLAHAFLFEIDTANIQIDKEEL